MKIIQKITYMLAYSLLLTAFSGYAMGSKVTKAATIAGSRLTKPTASAFVIRVNKPAGHIPYAANPLAMPQVGRPSYMGEFSQLKPIVPVAIAKSRKEDVKEDVQKAPKETVQPSVTAQMLKALATGPSSFYQAQWNNRLKSSQGFVPVTQTFGIKPVDEPSAEDVQETLAQSVPPTQEPEKIEQPVEIQTGVVPAQSAQSLIKAPQSELQISPLETIAQYDATIVPEQSIVAETGVVPFGQTNALIPSEKPENKEIIIRKDAALVPAQSIVVQTGVVPVQPALIAQRVPLPNSLEIIKQADTSLVPYQSGLVTEVQPIQEQKGIVKALPETEIMKYQNVTASPFQSIVVSGIGSVAQQGVIKELSESKEMITPHNSTKEPIQSVIESGVVAQEPITLKKAPEKDNVGIITRHDATTAPAQSGLVLEVQPTPAQTGLIKIVPETKDVMVRQEIKKEPEKQSVIESGRVPALQHVGYVQEVPQQDSRGVITRRDAAVNPAQSVIESGHIPALQHIGYGQPVPEEDTSGIITRHARIKPSTSKVVSIDDHRKMQTEFASMLPENTPQSLVPIASGDARIVSQAYIKKAKPIFIQLSDFLKKIKATFDQQGMVKDQTQAIQALRNIILQAQRQGFAVGVTTQNILDQEQNRALLISTINNALVTTKPTHKALIAPQQPMASDTPMIIGQPINGIVPFVMPLQGKTTQSFIDVVLDAQQDKKIAWLQALLAGVQFAQKQGLKYARLLLSETEQALLQDSSQSAPGDRTYASPQISAKEFENAASIAQNESAFTDEQQGNESATQEQDRSNGGRQSEDGQYHQQESFMREPSLMPLAQAAVLNKEQQKNNAGATKDDTTTAPKEKKIPGPTSAFAGRQKAIRIPVVKRVKRNLTPIHIAIDAYGVAIKNAIDSLQPIDLAWADNVKTLQDLFQNYNRRLQAMLAWPDSRIVSDAFERSYTNMNDFVLTTERSIEKIKAQ